MQDDLLFVMSDPENRYTVPQIAALLEMAKQQGHPLERSSYLEKMTIRQLDDLVHGKTDA